MSILKSKIPVSVLLITFSFLVIGSVFLVSATRAQNTAVGTGEIALNKVVDMASYTAYDRIDMSRASGLLDLSQERTEYMSITTHGYVYKLDFSWRNRDFKNWSPMGRVAERFDFVGISMYPVIAMCSNGDSYIYTSAGTWDRMPAMPVSGASGKRY
jgi:hypothetical protein